MQTETEKLLKSNDLSLTSVRLAVLEVLYQHPHSDADTIYQHVKADIATTSKQAIYNNLSALVEKGILREIKPKGSSSLYETRVNDNHHHLISFLLLSTQYLFSSSLNVLLQAPFESYLTLLKYV